MPENKSTEQRRSEFVDVAEKLFKENGIVETTISSIVKELDVAKGLFYYYFKSKDDVIGAITEKYNENFVKTMHQKMDCKDFDKKLDVFVDNCVTSFSQLWTNLNDDKAENIDLSQLETKSFEESKELASKELTSLLEEGNEQEKINVESPKLYADLMIAGMADLVKNGEDDLQQIKKIILDFIKRTKKEK